MNQKRKIPCLPELTSLENTVKDKDSVSNGFFLRTSKKKKTNGLKIKRKVRVCWNSVPSIVLSLIFHFLNTKTKICHLLLVNKIFQRVLQKPETWHFTSIRNTYFSQKILTREAETETCVTVRQFLKYATTIDVQIEFFPLDIDFRCLTSFFVNTKAEKILPIRFKKAIQTIKKNIKLEKLNLQFFPFTFGEMVCTKLSCLQSLDLELDSYIPLSDDTLVTIHTYCPFLKILKIIFLNYTGTKYGWNKLMNCAFLEELTCKSRDIYNPTLDVQSLSGFPLITRLTFLELYGFPSFNFLNVPVYQSLPTTKPQVVKLTRLFQTRKKRNILPFRGLPDVQQLIWNFTYSDRLNDSELQEIFACCPKLKNLEVDQIPKLFEEASFLCFESPSFQTLTCNFQTLTCIDVELQLWEFLKKIRGVVSWKTKISWEYSINSTTIVHFEQQDFPKWELNEIVETWATLKKNKNQFNEDCRTSKSLDFFNTLISQIPQNSSYCRNYRKLK